jgi:hypothetical protein
MALAGHLELEADDIIKEAGVRQLLRIRVPRWMEAAPTVGELAGLPAGVRRPLSAYFSARGE